MAETADAVVIGGRGETLTLPYLGREIDVGLYSGRREINPESSFSVPG